MEITFNNVVSNLNKTQYQPRFNLKSGYGNLRPLEKDTVCFTGGEKILVDGMKGGMSVSKEAANQIIREAKIVAKDYVNELRHYLAPLIVSAEHPEKPIKSITYRVKNDFSIREKAKTRKLRTIPEIKAGLDDLIGVRIITNNGSKEEIDKIIKRLTKGVGEGRFKIFEIENYCIDNKSGFASDAALNKLQQAGNKILSNGVIKREQSIPSGYTAIHLASFLPDGYKAEIQIMSSDVEKVKEIEDFIYKIKTNKTLGKKYKPIEEMLAELRINEALQRSVNSYTRNLYRIAREEGFHSKKYAFPPAPDYILPEFDFNKILKMKKVCDKQAK